MIASLLTVTLYLVNPNTKHKLWNIVSTRRCIPQILVLLESLVRDRLWSFTNALAPIRQLLRCSVIHDLYWYLECKSSYTISIVVKVEWNIHNTTPITDDCLLAWKWNPASRHRFPVMILVWLYIAPFFKMKPSVKTQISSNDSCLVVYSTVL
jgi:hypothetical protein